MRSSIKLAKVFGIEINAHISWIIILIMILFSMASYFSETQKEWSGPIQWSAALLTTLLFFISLITHELAHSLMAKQYRIRVRAITLFLFGGVSQLESEAEKPAAEFWIAIAGPLTSLALAGLFHTISLIADANTILGEATAWLAFINLTLAIFNILPGFPLDGGHVLRGLIWWITGSKKRADRMATEAGQILAMMMITIGMMLFFYTGGSFSGLWLALLGWYLLSTARSSFVEMSIADSLKRARTVDLMTNDYFTVRPDLSLTNFVEEYLLRSGRRFYFVAADERLCGIITITDLQALEPERWPHLRVADVMRPYDQLHILSPDNNVFEAMETMSEKNVNQLPVIANGKLIGVVTREHLVQFLSATMKFTHKSSLVAEKSRGKDNSQHSDPFNPTATPINQI